jgi:hypothetical protein
VPLVVCLVALAAGPAQAAPVSGRYDGRSPGSGGRSSLVVGTAGKAVSQYSLGARIPCSDGKTRFFSLRETRPRPPIANNTFRLVSRTVHRVRYVQKGPDPVGTLRIAATGTFGTDSVKGTITPSFVAKGLRCRATAPYRLALDGTPAAPYRDGLMATGTYSAFTSKAFSTSSFSTVAPGRELDGLVIRWRAPCKGGGSFSGRLPLLPAQLTSSARLAMLPVAAGTVRGKPGLRYASEGKLALRFFKQGTAYRARGTFRAITVLTRKGKKVGTCTSAPAAFTSRFLRGPR